VGTKKNLEQEVAGKSFREDLFFRLNVVRIQLPPLRHRVEDIRLLAEYFVKKVATKKHLPPISLTEEAMRAMESYAWPGNVRELENTIQRATELANSDVILAKDLPLGDKSIPLETDLDSATASLKSNKERAIDFLLGAAKSNPEQLLPWLERVFILHALRVRGGNQVQSAKLLGITRMTLRKRIEIYGITRESYIP